MRLRPFLYAAALVCVAGVVYPQTSTTGPQGQAQPQAPDGGQVSVDVVQVRMLVSVTDNRGKLVTNLKPEDFRIYEDDRLQKIDSFSSETSLPLSIAMLIDSSGSIIDKLRFEQEAAIDFFFNTIQRRKDRATLIGFDTQAYELRDFTDQPEELAEGVKEIRAGGGTAVYDAVYLSVLKKLAGEDEERRKLIVLISDGDDVASRYSLTEALEAAQRNHVTIYAVSTNKTSDTKRSDQVRGDDIINRMVEETGGRAYFPLKLEDLAADFQKIGDELRAQYVVFYTSTNPIMDGTYREVRVEMVDKKYRARTRAGYFATKSDSSN